VFGALESREGGAAHRICPSCSRTFCTPLATRTGGLRRAPAVGAQLAPTLNAQHRESDLSGDSPGAGVRAALGWSDRLLWLIRRSRATRGQDDIRAILRDEHGQ